jgi:hypothetical protein
MFRRGRYVLLAVALSFGLWGVSALGASAGDTDGRSPDPPSALSAVGEPSAVHAGVLTRTASASPGARLQASVVAVVAAAAGLHLVRRRLRSDGVARLPLWTAWSADPARWRAPPVTAS